MTDDPKQTLSPEEFGEAGLPDWRMVSDVLHARFETGSFSKGLDLVNRIGAAAEERNHHPDIVLTYPCVDVRLSSHDVGGVTSRDIDLAGVISGLAADVGATPAPDQAGSAD